MSPSKKKRLTQYKKEYQALLQSLGKLGFIWHGNLQRRMLPCKSPRCACNLHLQPQHGPYPYWTTKVNQKTVTKLLTTEEADLYEEWIENRRKLEATIKRLNDISKKAAKLIISDSKLAFS